MKLLYCYFPKLKSIENIEISFTSKFIFKRETDDKGNTTKIEILKNENHIDEFFSKNDKIEVTGIIGENGTGKTTILDGLLNLIKDASIESKYILIYSDGYSIEWHSEIFNPDLDIIYKDIPVAFGETAINDDIVINFLDSFSYLKLNSSGLFDFAKYDLIIDVDTDDFNDIDYILYNYYDFYIRNMLSKEFNLMSLFYDDCLSNLSKSYNSLIKLYRHIDLNLLTNIFILKTRSSGDSLSEYIPNRAIALRPFLLTEFCNGDYTNNNAVNGAIKNKSIKTTLNERETVYTLASIVKNYLAEVIPENTIKDCDIDLLTHLIIDYLFLINKKNKKTVFSICDAILSPINNNQTNDIISLLSAFKEYLYDKIIYKKLNQYESAFMMAIVENIITLYNTLCSKPNYSKFDYYIVDDIDDIHIINDLAFLQKYFKLYQKINPNIETHSELNDFPFSSGELHLITLISSIQTYLIDFSMVNRRSLLLLLDEPDITLHPNWQRQFWNKLLPMLEKIAINTPKCYIQLVFTSHSPLLISDIPKMNLNILSKNKEVTDIANETFCANIYDLYKSSFFLDSPIGEFALSKIKPFYDFYNEFKNLPSLDKEQIKELRDFEKLVNIIGEPLIKRDMENKLMYLRSKQSNNDWEEFIHNLTDEQKRTIMNVNLEK